MNFAVMVTLSLDVFFFLFLSAGLSLVIGLWFYYDWRDRSLYELERFPVLFHCIKCDSIYTAKRESDLVACPHCRFENSRLIF